MISQSILPKQRKMKKDIRIRIADSSGNITIFVFDRFSRSEYEETGRRLLAMDELGGEQVAFVTGPRSFEMSGLEFCGNASRAFALMAADGTEKQVIDIDVSGTDRPVRVTVVPEISYAAAEMPLPREVVPADDRDWPELRGATAVVCDGITHLVIPGEEDTALFERAKRYMTEKYDPAALGVMFCRVSRREIEMTPVVYVRAVESLYREGSCGSGTMAVAAALTQGKADGKYVYTVKQPAGTITVTASAKGGEVTGIVIEGGVSLGDERIVTLEYDDDNEDDETFPSIDEFRDIVSELLDELPEEFFKELSGGVVVEPGMMRPDYARGDDISTLGQYVRSGLGRQIKIFYGSFREAFPRIDREHLKGRVRDTVRHEFRHHLEGLAGMHGRDSLEAEDRAEMERYLKVKDR